MGFFDRLAASVGNPFPVRAVRAGGQAAPITSGNDPKAIAVLAKALAGGRITTAFPNQFIPAVGFQVPPASPEAQWQYLNLDEGRISDYPPYRLLELLADLSPDISRSVYDTLRMISGDWSIACYQPRVPGAPQAAGSIPDEIAQAAIATFLDRLTDRHGSVDVVIGRLFLNALFRGAFFSELVLDETRTPIDLVMPDPISVRFDIVKDPLVGARWRMGQLQAGKFVPIDRPTVRYLPIDPLPDSPYGRSPLAPSLFPALFLLSMMHDIRRVIAQQGYPRLDIEIDYDAMLAAMPPELSGSVEEMGIWAQKHIDDVTAVYTKLPPDAAYIHASTIKINRPVGTADASSLGGIGNVITALERMLVRALKTMPLIMGMSDGVSEANANRQWEIQLTGLRKLQNYAETMLERQLSLALRAQGIQAIVELVFRENRKAEEQRDEQVAQMRGANARFFYESGWISQDEAAQMAVGHKADQAKPRSDFAPPPAAAAGGGATGAAKATTQGGNKDGTPPKGNDGGRETRDDLPDRYPVPIRDADERRQRETA